MIHASGQRLRHENNVIGYVPTGDNLASKLLNDWLPRDNARR